MRFYIKYFFCLLFFIFTSCSRTINDNNLVVGDGTDTDKFITFDLLSTDVGIKYDQVSGKILLKATSAGAYNEIGTGSGSLLGDCTWSLLSEAQFQAVHGTGWVLLSGQSISGSDLDNSYSISSLPDMVNNGAFIRQVGGNSDSIRVFQNDATSVNGLSVSNDNSLTGSFYVHGDAGNTTTGPFSLTRNIINDTWGNGAGDTDRVNFNGTHNHAITGDTETRPNNIALNFFCKINN